MVHPNAPVRTHLLAILNDRTLSDPEAVKQALILLGHWPPEPVPDTDAMPER